jgi:hypothetical protein
MEQLQVTAINDDGSVKFEGMIGKKEVAFLLEIGINFLMAQGTLPFLGEDDDEEDDFPPITVDGPSTKQ